MLLAPLAAHAADRRGPRPARGRDPRMGGAAALALGLALAALGGAAQAAVAQAPRLDRRAPAAAALVPGRRQKLALRTATRAAFAEANRARLEALTAELRATGLPIDNGRAMAALSLPQIRAATRGDGLLGELALRLGGRRSDPGAGAVALEEPDTDFLAAYPTHREATRLRVARHLVGMLEEHTVDLFPPRADLARAAARHGERFVALVHELRRGLAGQRLEDRDVRGRRTAMSLPIFGRARGAALAPELFRHHAPREPEPMRAFWSLVPEETDLAHPDAAALIGFDVLAHQHLLASTGELFRALRNLGAFAISALGKSYSQDAAVVDRLRFQGELRPGSGRHGPDVEAWLEHYFSNRRRELAVRGARSPFLSVGHSLLLLDDGGELILRVNALLERIPASERPRIVAVEQTTRGLRRLEGVRLAFPVIDVAGSWAKRTYEAPLIGRSVAQSVERERTRLARDGHALPRRVLLVGYGAVGEATARALRAEGYAVTLFDADPTRRARAAEHGFEVAPSLEDAASTAQLLVSATGAPAITDAVLDRLPDSAVLLNAGSADSEWAFDRAARSADDRAYRTGTQRFRGRALVTDLARGVPARVLRTARGEALLLHDGGVVNFGSADPIPARYIQLTRGLLYLASLQAARTEQPGLHALSRAPQEDLVRRVEAELAETGESLLRPTF